MRNQEERNLLTTACTSRAKTEDFLTFLCLRSKWHNWCWRSGYACKKQQPWSWQVHFLFWHVCCWCCCHHISEVTLQNDDNEFFFHEIDYEQCPFFCSPSCMKKKKRHKFKNSYGKSGGQDVWGKKHPSRISALDFPLPFLHLYFFFASCSMD